MDGQGNQRFVPQYTGEAMSAVPRSERREAMILFGKHAAKNCVPRFPFSTSIADSLRNWGTTSSASLRLAHPPKDFST